MANESGHQIDSSLATPSLRSPRYSFVFQDPADTSAGAGRSPTIYAFSLPDEPTKGQLPWVTLHIQTRPSSRIQKYPRFLEGDNVSGTIDLNLLNPQSINTISVVNNHFATGRALNFLEEHHIVWEKADGDPRSRTPTRGFAEKLSGNYKFSFSFPFPSHIDLSSTLGSTGKNKSQDSLIYPTPPTTLEHGLGAGIQYHLTLNITHGTLRLDSKLKTIVTYLPEILSAPSSPLRQNAYLEGTLLPGPDRDPDGWVTLPSVVVRGKLKMAGVPTDMQCTLSLSLASPLSYTRGTVIPCYLTLSSETASALEFLADHKHQYVRLARTAQFAEDPLNVSINSVKTNNPKCSVVHITEIGLTSWSISPKDII